jgi:hypothetical protein
MKFLPLDNSSIKQRHSRRKKGKRVKKKKKEKQLKLR